MKPLPHRFRDENVFFSSKIRPKNGWKIDFSPPNIKNQPLTTLWIDRSWNFESLVVWIPLYNQIWPIWWRKRITNLSKCRFPTVPDSSQGFTEASRPFQILPEDLRWCPKVPSLLPRHCMLRKNWSPSVEKKVTTECREKSACQQRSAYMSRKKWSQRGEKKLMTDECWLLIDHWSLMIDD